MQNQLPNTLTINNNMNFYGINHTLCANQALQNSNINLNNINGLQTSSNPTLNTILQSSGASSYKQFLQFNKGSNHQINDSNNSPNITHKNINISQINNKKIIVKHSNIVKKKRQIKIWTSDEDQLLKKLCEQIPGKWIEIAQQIGGRNASQCSQRWRRILPIKVRKPWTLEEDQKVLELIQKFGKNWGMIAQHIEGKTGKQVRERYINKLDPSIKRTPWTEEEDQKILDMFLEQGPKWSTISNELVGRPENTVKNRFYSHISRIYLSDDNSFFANKNNDNKQKIKDACQNNSKNSIQKKLKGSSNKREIMIQENDENQIEDNEDDDDEDEDLDDDEEQNESNSQDNVQKNNNSSSVSNKAFVESKNKMTHEASSKKQY